MSVGGEVQKWKKREQSFAPRAPSREAAPDGFVFVKSADVFLHVVEWRTRRLATFFRGRHKGTLVVLSGDC